MDIRVGKIVEVGPTPGSEHLYSEKIDIGGEIRDIGSGLREHVTLDEMKDKLVIVLCNLPPRSLAKGAIISHGMVLCGQTNDKSKVELLIPPEGSQPGDVITFSGFERKPPAELPKKKSAWETVAPKLVVDANGVACYDNIPFTTDKGVVTSKTVRSGIVG